MDKNAKVLIADDSAFMRKILTDIIKGEGFENILEAENGKQAVEMFETEHPDLVLLDIVMPEMDGIQVLEEIGKKAKTVVIISAIGQEETINKAKELGAKGYVVKPFDNKQVAEEIKKALGV